MNHLFTLHNTEGVKVFLPIDSVIRDDGNPCNLEVGSLIQYGDPPCYGVIRWMGMLFTTNVLMAGVDMVST